MNTGVYDLDILKGNDFLQNLQFATDAAGLNPIDITDNTFKAEIRESQSRSSTLIATFTVTIVNAVNGQISMSLTDTQTGAIERRQGFWDILRTDLAGFDSTPIGGVVNFKDTVTVK